MTKHNKIVLAVVGGVVAIGIIAAAATSGGGGYGGGVPVGVDPAALHQARMNQQTFQIMNEMQQQQHETNMNIIRNMGANSCVKGQDLNCY